MANKTLREYSAPTTDNIRIGPNVDVGEEGFEFKPGLIIMVQGNQFSGKTHEDVSAHLQHFLEICNTFKIKGVIKDVIQLRLFPFSLLGRTKQWFYISKDKKTTCDLCALAFLAKFFPIAKTNALRFLACFIDESWDQKLTQVREDGFSGQRVLWILRDVLMPITVKLLCALCVPYVLTKGMAPRFSYSADVNSVVLRFAWLGSLGMGVLCYVAGTL